MGTRNLTCAVLDGDYRIAQYGQWDGYPDGQGAHMLEFARKLMDSPDALERFKAHVRASRFGSDEEIKAAYEPFSSPEGWMTMPSAAAFQRSKYGYLSRDVGSKIFDRMLESSEPMMLQNSISFAADGLFCEWVWVIDFDAGVFEGFKGFQHEPVPEGERFAHLNDEVQSVPSGNVYYPPHLAGRWPLTQLPSMEAFLEHFREEDEDEEEEDAANAEE